MTYYAILRSCIVNIFFLIAWILSKKTKFFERILPFGRKVRLILVIGISVILVTALFAVPFENLFITFSSRDSAYSYYNSNELTHVVDGKCSDLAISQNSKGCSISVIKRDGDGWKIGRNSDLVTVKFIANHDTTIRLLRYKNTDDYYISICTEGAASVKDNNSTKFVQLSYVFENSNVEFFDYYGYIHDYGEWYELTVNGDNIQF